MLLDQQRQLHIKICSAFHVFSIKEVCGYLPDSAGLEKNIANCDLEKALMGTLQINLPDAIWFTFISQFISYKCPIEYSMNQHM